MLSALCPVCYPPYVPLKVGATISDNGLLCFCRGPCLSYGNLDEDWYLNHNLLIRLVFPMVVLSDLDIDFNACYKHLSILLDFLSSLLYRVILIFFMPDFAIFLFY